MKGFPLVAIAATILLFTTCAEHEAEKEKETTFTVTIPIQIDTTIYKE